MKLTVKKIFRDKKDKVTLYEAGTIIDVKDAERASDLLKRGLCAEYKGKKAASLTLGEESPAKEPPIEESPEVTDEGKTPETETQE